MNPIQKQILLDLLADVNGSTFISVSTDTIPMMNKTTGGEGTPDNPHYGRIIKRQTGSSVMAFQNKRINGYQSMVRRRLVAEDKDPDSFVLSPRRWGERVPNMPLVVHNGEYYLEVIFLRPGPVEYLLDGKPIALSSIIGLRDYTPPEQGGLDRKVQLRVINFDSIRHLLIDGVEFELS